jgi:hypothetical protein
MISTVKHHPSSYRDPSGFIFEKDGALYRQVNIIFKDHFTHFIQSGCYKHLIEKGLLIPHEEIHTNLSGDSDHFTTLKPERVSFITYPYEWSFDMLKDAALLTLQLAKECLQYNVILKDATPYNIQWHKDRLIFIDSLSFEKYEEKPWVAYRQFCECFLGPLLLMHYSKKHLQPLQLAWPDGIPLNIIQSLLPKRSRFSIHTYLHIHLHNKVSVKKGQETSQNPKQANPTQKFAKQKFLNLITSLEALINKLSVPAALGTWSDYYEEVAQRSDYLDQKKSIISTWIDKLPAISTAADLGANEGVFSRLVASKGIRTISADFDPYCINTLYNALRSNKEKNIQPLILDLANPSPATGVNNEERAAFTNRIKADLTLALALVHHLAIGKNISLDKIAAFFSSVSKHLIIEFVPLEDEKVQLMLSQKEIAYPHYTIGEFESNFQQYFTIDRKELIAGSSRVLYLMNKK